MLAFILGSPYSRAQYATPSNYRGLERKELAPRVSDANSIEANELHTLINEFYHNNVNKSKSLKTLLYYSRKFSELLKEPYELILSMDIEEMLPQNIEHEFLGYEVTPFLDDSMIYFCLRQKFFEPYEIYDRNQPKLNQNFLFDSIEDAKNFIEDINVIKDPASPLYYSDYADCEFLAKKIYLVKNIVVATDDDIIINKSSFDAKQKHKPIDIFVQNGNVIRVYDPEDDSESAQEDPSVPAQPTRKSNIGIIVLVSIMLIILFIFFKIIFALWL